MRKFPEIPICEVTKKPDEKPTNTRGKKAQADLFAKSNRARLTSQQKAGNRGTAPAGNNNNKVIKTINGNRRLYIAKILKKAGLITHVKVRFSNN